MENAVFTFEQLLSPHLQGEPSKTAVAIEKVKLRVLKVKPFSHWQEAYSKNATPGSSVRWEMPSSFLHLPSFLSHLSPAFLPEVPVTVT